MTYMNQLFKYQLSLCRLELLNIYEGIVTLNALINWSHSYLLAKSLDSLLISKNCKCWIFNDIHESTFKYQMSLFRHEHLNVCEGIVSLRLYHSSNHILNHWKKPSIELNTNHILVRMKILKLILVHAQILFAIGMFHLTLIWKYIYNHWLELDHNYDTSHRSFW
jgi:hypothetical protein